MDDKYELIKSSVRDTIGSVVWSHKIQEKQSDIYSHRYKWMETANVLAASITSAGIVSLIFTDQLWVKIVSALISLVSVFIGAILKSFDLQSMISQHKAAANDLLVIRDELKLLLLKVHMKQEDPRTIESEYAAIVHKLDDVYADAPSTTDKAVMLARIALNITKDNTFTDAEIDNFLPKELRRNK